MTWTSDCGTVRLFCGDCLDVLPTLEAGSVDAVVTDPPYGLSFMGKHWDHGIPGEQFWREVIRVAKPGCHLLAFGGTRTYHRLACAIEDAGWEVRDCLGWIYGSGFPKSHNLRGQWQGWGTALKPAWEPIILARKPLVGTVAANVTRYGTGALNIDGCRVPHGDDVDLTAVQRQSVDSGGGWGMCRSAIAKGEIPMYKPAGRWPANVIHDGSDEVVGLFPVTLSGNGKPKIAKRARNKGWANSSPGDGVEAIDSYGDFGSAARFFYCAKASKADRDEGCEGLGAKSRLEDVGNEWTTVDYREGHSRNVMARNHHPTVKPTDLMRWLVRLVTPPGGTVLDPFMGSGSTGKAAKLEGFRFVGIEREAEYHELAKRRIEGELKRFPLFEQSEEPKQATLFGDDRD